MMVGIFLLDVPVKLHAAKDISFGVVWMAM